MPRKYHHIVQLEKEILELKAKGYTSKQIHDCITRRNRRIKKAEAGVQVKRKGHCRVAAPQ